MKKMLSNSDRLWRGEGPRQQPVGREPGDAHREADDRRRDDAQHRDQQGVEQADHEGAAVGVVAGVVDQRLGDGKAGTLAEEVEAGADAAGLEIGQGVVDQKTDEDRQEREQQPLDDQGAHGGVAPQRTPPATRDGRGGTQHE
ncbi:hypothetical protein [Modicisalibacter coralii]|uniref:hypothetical protein n=1 Tax=Modicisalibacter coralii TaxID=2304602 RepID=UPI001F343F13|nr:hypothetical protein [Halomonas coralii]